MRYLRMLSNSIATGSLATVYVLIVVMHPIGRDTDGYARTDLFLRAFTDERPITFIPTYDR